MVLQQSTPSTLQTADVSTGLTTDTSVVHGTSKEFSDRDNQQDGLRTLQENYEVSVTSKTVRESTQEHSHSSTLKNIATSLQPAIENTIGSYDGQVVEALNVAIQPREKVALVSVGSVESVHGGINASMQLTAQTSSELEIDESNTLVSVSTSSGPDARKFRDITTVHPVRESVQEVAMGEIVETSTKNSELSTQATSQTSAALEIGTSNAITEVIEQHGDRSLVEVADVVTLGGQRELSGSSTQQTTQTSARETAETSTLQIAQASTELKIGQPTDHVQEFVDSSEQIAQTSKQIAHIFTLKGNTVRQPESGRDIGQSSIMLTPQAGELTSDALLALGETNVEDDVRESVIRVSIGEEGYVVCGAEGETDSSSVDGKTVTATIQGTTALSFEHVQASTESAAYMQSSTQENSTALKTTTQVAVTDSEQHRREQLVDSLSSSTQNTSNIAIKSVEDVMVGAITNKNKKVHAPSTATEYNILSCEFSGFRVRK